jgi:hypothetical protein
MSNDILFENKPIEQRQQLLKDNAYSVSVEEIEIPLMHQELMEIDNIILEESNKVDEYNIQLAKLSAEYKANKKEIEKNLAPHQGALSNALNEKRTGTRSTKQEVYHFDNQESGIMETRNMEGRLISTRPLTPKEKQSSILSINKTGTNQ